MKTKTNSIFYPILVCKNRYTNAAVSIHSLILVADPVIFPVFDTVSSEEMVGFEKYSYRHWHISLYNEALVAIPELYTQEYSPSTKKVKS